MRTFIALELSEDVKASLLSLQGKLKAGQFPFVKWVDPGGIHLTLQFLGSIPADMATRVAEAIEEAVQGMTPFRLVITGLGVFPSWQSPRVVWVGVGGDVEKLKVLQRSIEGALSPLGFPEEGRPFAPHLTLGRLREGTQSRERQRFGEFVKEVPFEGGLAFNIVDVRLMKSTLTRSGAIYDCLYRAPLSTS